MSPYDVATYPSSYSLAIRYSPAIPLINPVFYTAVEIVAKVILFYEFIENEGALEFSSPNLETLIGEKMVPSGVLPVQVPFQDIVDVTWSNFFY